MPYIGGAMRECQTCTLRPHGCVLVNGVNMGDVDVDVANVDALFFFVRMGSALFC